jgi:hypothetical protein
LFSHTAYIHNDNNNHSNTNTLAIVTILTPAITSIIRALPIMLQLMIMIITVLTGYEYSATLRIII